jgi:hypothetical protein
LSAFWKPIYVACFKDFPFQDPNATEIAKSDGDVEKARAEKLKSEKTVQSKRNSQDRMKLTFSTSSICTTGFSTIPEHPPQELGRNKFLT